MTGYRFGDFSIDCDRRLLLHRDRPVHLSPKAFLLLQVLVEAAPKALSKSALQDRLWPDTFVVEANLHHLIAEIRTALGEEPQRARWVRTVHRFGYAFQDAPERIEQRPDRGVVCRLRWEGGRTTLASGEHVVGRDASADVVIDSTTVSRRHARIRIAGEEVTLEDLGSKNGSFVGSRRVEGTQRLADGDTIRIGMVPVNVRISAVAPSTQTAVRASSG
jgi:DNA-binding winged helix-turn-helix (wHTH) protein